MQLETYNFCWQSPFLGSWKSDEPDKIEPAGLGYIETPFLLKQATRNLAYV